MCAKGYTKATVAAENDVDDVFTCVDCASSSMVKGYSNMDLSLALEIDMVMVMVMNMDMRIDQEYKL